MTMRIIFLDIDGVLNTERYSAWLQDRGLPCRDQYGILMFDPSAVANLKRILNALPDVRIVLESTWTFAGHPDALRFMWAERGLPGALHDVIETIFTKHVLKNAAIPIIHGIPGSILGAMVGAFMTERVYVVPGIGGLLINAINAYDNGVIVGVTLFYAVISVVSMILGDILMALVDPRINFTSKAR